MRTGELPAVYTPSSGVALEHRVETAAEAAAVLCAPSHLGQGDVPLANPIPAETALDPAFVGDFVAR